ncbi:hypothetical protein [Bermanella sp. R86510]|uniref:hypothetical protein n=1 Tax=unclassified Bermanella TaxID=2627862 RepID=UPI0037C97F64
MLKLSNCMFLLAATVLILSLWVGFQYEQSLPLGWLIACHILPMLATLAIKLAYILRLKALSSFE